MYFANKKVLITAGATYEPIDPVRFIGNRSTGRMGLALVEVLLEKGAIVKWVLGAHAITVPTHPHLTVYYAETALAMYDICLNYFSWADLVLKVAAVADFRPAQVAKEKIKKEVEKEEIFLRLVKNPDILYELGRRKTHQKLVGFALETNEGFDNARRKLKHKNLDAIVLNSLQEKGAGFGVETNICHFLVANNTAVKSFNLDSKKEIAKKICEQIAHLQYK